MNPLPKRYFWTPFNRAQILELQQHLNLKTKADAVDAALWIRFTIENCRRDAESRHRVSDTKTAKRRLDRIATQAANLSRLLAEEPIAEHLVRPPGSFLNRSVDGVVDMPALREADQQKLHDLVATLRVISAQAGHLACDDLSFRSAHQLPPIWGTGKTPIVLWLWPQLFAIWEGSGRRVAKTAEGPLHKFVKFVHDVCGLASVSPSTLKDAVADWKQDRRPARPAWEPPSRIDGED
jgi:hypothetical protein